MIEKEKTDFKKNIYGSIPVSIVTTDKINETSNFSVYQLILERVKYDPYTEEFNFCQGRICPCHPPFFPRSNMWCGVAQYGATWLIWCGVAQLVARRLAGRQARVRFSARHHREVFPH
jgi:hypothetical protein